MKPNPTNKAYKCTKSKLVLDMERFLNNLYVTCQNLTNDSTNINWVEFIWKQEKEGQPAWILDLMNYIEEFYEEEDIKEWVQVGGWKQFYDGKY
tara:strand:+ start:503 stop:784 length:282 start_codon:yes stop_codon:yes gene_type:complete